MMITDRFVFIHMHKCGGTFVNGFIRKFFPEARSEGYHYPVAMLPSEVKDLPRLASVRNPWDWYVSYYAFQNKIRETLATVMTQLGPDGAETLIAGGIDPKNGLDVVFEAASRTNTFAATTRCLLELGTDPLLDELLATLPARVNGRAAGAPVMGEMFRGMNLTAARLAPIRGTGVGFYGHLFGDMHGDLDGYHWLKMASLREDLLATLDEIGVEISSEMSAYVRGSERVNTSRHHSRQDSYSDELAERVAERESALIARFGYRF